MSLDRIKKILSEEVEPFNVYEHTLKQIGNDLLKNIHDLDSIIEDKGYEASNEAVNKAEQIKELLNQALNVINSTSEDFDGSLADLGTTPTAALSMVDARGGSRKLAGYAGLPKKKKRKAKKHESNEKCPDCGASMSGNECYACGFRQEDADDASRFYDRHKKQVEKPNEDLNTELDLLNQSKVRLKLASDSIDNSRKNIKSEICQ